MTITYRKRQQDGIVLAAERPRFGFGWKPGVGKTYLGTGIIDLNRPLRTLVTAPKALLEDAWANALAHYPHIPYVIVHGDNAARRRQMIARDGWRVAITTLETGGKHIEDFLAAGVKRLIIDESGKTRNPDALRTKNAQHLASKVDEVYLLSGTMAPKDFTNYWAQLAMLDRSIDPFYKWCHTYGYPIKKNVRVRGKIKSVIDRWEQTPEQAAALNAYLAKWCQFLRLEDCEDMPPEQSLIVPVELSAEETAAYVEMSENMAMEDGDGKIIQVKNSFSKLRQVTGGRMIGGPPIGTSKLDALSDLLDEIGSDEPVVIWAEFTHEIDAIREMLESREEFVRLNQYVDVLDGRTSHKAGQIAGMFQMGKLDYLICHPAAAAHGLTFTRACYDIEFSGSYDADQCEQKFRRVFRTGQKRPVTHYSLLASLRGFEGRDAETVDHSAYAVSRRRMKESEALEMEVERARKRATKAAAGV